MPHPHIIPCGEWLNPDMIRWDSAIYKGKLLRLVDNTEGDSAVVSAVMLHYLSISTL